MPVSSVDFSKWREESGLRILVETGTYIGGGIRHALRGGMERVVSIEASDDYFRNAQGLFGNDPRVSLVLGDSSTTLGQVLLGIDEPVIFWLDAHSSGGKTFNGPDPLIGEIKAIFGWKHAPKSWIFADDCTIGEKRVTTAHVVLGRTHLLKPVDATMPSDEGYGAAGGHPWIYTVGWVPIGDKP